jgi:hypothetical protein
MLAEAYGIFICVAGVVGLIWILYVMRNGDKDRHQEDDARAFFDEHGHWPDEDPPAEGEGEGPGSGEVQDPGAGEPGRDLPLEERP